MIRGETFVVAAAVLFCACGSDGQSTARDFADRAASYAAEGRYEAAAIEYRNAIKHQPDWADAHLKLADTLMALGSPDSAYRAYEDACTLRPTGLHACLQAARLLLGAGAGADALYRAQALVDRFPAHVDSQLLLASALVRLGRASQAVRVLNKAIAIDHRPAAYGALGDVHAAAGDLKAAEAAFRSGVKRSPASPEARVHLARFLIRAERKVEAESELLEAIQSSPDDELANRALASLYLSTGRTVDAEKHLSIAALQPDRKHRSLLALADFYAANKRWDEARAVLNRAPPEGELTLAARVRLAAIQYETGDPDGAHRALAAVLKRRPTAEGWVLQAQFFAREQRLDEALEAARRALGMQPSLAPAHRIVAAIERARGNLPSAFEALRATSGIRR